MYMYMYICIIYIYTVNTFSVDTSTCILYALQLDQIQFTHALRTIRTQSCDYPIWVPRRGVRSRQVSPTRLTQSLMPIQLLDWKWLVASRRNRASGQQVHYLVTNPVNYWKQVTGQLMVLVELTQIWRTNPYCLVPSWQNFVDPRRQTCTYVSRVNLVLIRN